MAIKIRKNQLQHNASFVDQSRRLFIKALPGLALTPSLLAQGEASPIDIKKLHSFGLRVSNIGRSLKFYQDIFGCPIQAWQGDTICLQIGDGPSFFSLSPLRSGEEPGFIHVGLSVENFELNKLRNQLSAFDIEEVVKLAPRKASLNIALRSWISTRGEDMGGAASGTQDLFFADVEGLIYQLSSEDHCGGSGENGSVCEALKPAPSQGLF